MDKVVGGCILGDNSVPSGKRSAVDGRQRPVASTTTTVRSSGGTTYVGRLNRRSRSLARTLFTEAVLHLADSSPLFGRFYRKLVQRKGCGRARVAILRKTFGMMRRILLSNTPYRWKEESLYQSKLKDWVRIQRTEEESKIPA